jgi:hypothetical protein
MIPIARLHRSERAVTGECDGEGEDWWAKRSSQRKAKEVRNKKRRWRMDSHKIITYELII